MMKIPNCKSQLHSSRDFLRHVINFEEGDIEGLTEYGQSRAHQPLSPSSRSRSPHCHVYIETYLSLQFGTVQVYGHAAEHDDCFQVLFDITDGEG